MTGLYGLAGLPEPDASGHARETCPRMTAEDLERGAPHWCLAAVRAQLPGGGWVSTRGPWTNAELAGLRAQFAELDRQLYALEQLEPPADPAEPTDADLARLGHLFLTGLTAAELLARRPREIVGYLPTEPGTQLEFTARPARGPRWLRAIRRRFWLLACRVTGW